MKAILLLALVFTAMPARADTIERRSERYTLGMQGTIPLDFEPCTNTFECVRIANKALAQLQYAPGTHQIILTPMKPGETTITIRDGKGDERVVIDALMTSVNLDREVADLRELFKDFKGVEVTVISDFVRLDGELRSVEELGRFQAVVRDPAYAQIMNLVRPSAATIVKGAKLLETKLADRGVKVSPWPKNSFVLEGKVESEKKAAEILVLADKLARAMGFEPIKGTELVISKLEVSPASH